MCPNSSQGHALDVLCTQVTRDVFAIVKFLFLSHFTRELMKLPHSKIYHITTTFNVCIVIYQIIHQILPINGISMANRLRWLIKKLLYYRTLSTATLNVFCMKSKIGKLMHFAVWFLLIWNVVANNDLRHLANYNAKWSFKFSIECKANGQCTYRVYSTN